MTMALIDRRIGGQAIQVLIALYIPYPDAFASAQDHIQRLVIMSTKLVFKVDEFLCFHITQKGV